MKLSRLVGSSILALAIAASLSACGSDGNLTPAATKALTIACKVDAIAQPVAVPLAEALAPEVAAAGTLDQQLLHPAVVAACSAVNGTPIGVTTATPAAPAPVITAPSS